ncbi:putative ribonuclease P/MRP protein subunit RPP1 [Blattamonas nauphoetae]|uniref:Ribonuclease P/MRP protein subunit RPP1 n=1 Tax=Blattamonas nauphoetae TaxID=2049346 RepID=A0ABQ9YLL1_9EUKA|nr:putative ribonuclease P/MRP protein subunit RPP1 [Blattamonas nauphoetae]
MTYDLNIPSIQDEKLLVQIIFEHVANGFTTLALNHYVDGKYESHDTFKTKEPSLSRIKELLKTYQPSVPSLDLSQLQLFRRLTVVLEQDSQVARILQGEIVQISSESNWGYRPKAPQLRSARKRGIRFEMLYTQIFKGQSARIDFLSNFSQLLTLTRKKGIILSSGQRELHTLRKPAELVSLVKVFKLSNKDALSMVTEAPHFSLCLGAARRCKNGMIRIIEGDLIPRREEQPTPAQPN